MKPKSIRTYLVLLTLPLAVLVAALVGYDAYHDVHMGVADTQVQLRTVASLIISNTAGRIADARSILENLAARPLVKRLDPGHCDEALTELQRTLQPVYSNILYTDLNGRAVCSALPLPGDKPADFGAMPWFRQIVKEQRFTVGQPHYGPVTGKWIAVLAVPIRNDRNEMVGTIHLSLDLSALDPQVPARLLPEKSRYGFFTGDGILIWRNADPERVIGTRPDAEAARRIMAVRDGDLEDTGVDGVLRVYTAMTMPETGWIAWAGIPASPVYSGARQLALIRAGIVLAGFSVLAFLVIVISRRITRPVEELANAALAVHRGDRGARAEVAGPREIAEVAQEFNAMLAAQQRNDEQFRALLENSAVIAWFNDEEGRLVYASNNFLRRFALQREAVIGKTADQIWPKAIADEFRRNDLKLLSGGGAIEAVESATEHDGRTSWWLSNKFVFQGADGKRLVGGLAVDITERRKAEEALRASETRYERAVNGANDGIWEWNPATGDDYLSPRWKQLLGFQNHELPNVQASFFDRIHPDDQARVAAAVRAHFEQRAPFEVELRMRCKSGEYRWFNSRGEALRDAGGRPSLMAGSMTDITERKQLEEAMRRSQEHLTSLVNSLDGIVWEADADTFQFTFVSPRAETMLGHSLSRWTAEPTFWADHIHADDRENSVRYCVQCTREKRDHVFEYRMLTADGRAVWLRDIVTVVVEDGRPVKLRGIMVDITAIKQAEEQLRKLSMAVEQSLEGIVITDAQGTIEYVNDSFVRVTGYHRDELIGRNPRLLQSGKTPRATYESLWAALLQGRPWTGELHNRRKDGTEYLEVAVISPIRQADGRITHYVGVKEDITAKRRDADELEWHRHHLEELVAERTAQLEEARRQADAANQAKSAFLANMSHEIRTPMNGVLGMLEVLDQTRLTEQQAEMLRTARDSGRTLLGIIDDILDFSKIEAGRLHIEFGPISVLDEVEGLCDSLMPMAGRREVDLSVFVAPEIPEQLRSDPLRLRQMLFNLAGNAVKFSAGRPGKRGRVSLRVTVASRQPLRLAFTVVDNGIGMSPDVVERLFEPFSQGEASTTRRFGGTGLGLTICKRLADLMHGEIAVASRLNEGSTFTLTLPFDVPAVQPTRAVPDLAGIDCLVMDAPEMDIDGMCIYLRHAGARVQRVADAPEEAQIADGLAGPVVAIHHVGHAHAAPEIGLRHARNIRYLLIGRGRRRRIRVESPDVVSLDTTTVRRQMLLQAVAVAAGRAAPEAVADTAAPAQGEKPAPPLPAARDGGELILVAEDDEINQTVIRSQLELLGFTAEIARDGAEALRLWRDGRYALLLTDLHMPNMDGYTLARTIRQQETERGEGAAGHHRMPIIALTANALRGEADRARSIGMDDYLTKPLQLDQLRKALARWITSGGGEAMRATELSRPREEGPGPAVDIAVLESLIGNDARTVRECLSLYLNSVRRTRSEFRSACDEGDLPQAGGLAHQLKSSSRYVGALPLGDLSAELERASKQGDLAAVRAHIARFEAEIQRVETEIGQLLAAK